MIDDDIRPRLTIIIRFGDLAIQIARQHIFFRERDCLLNGIIPGENSAPIIHAIRKHQFCDHVNSFLLSPDEIVRGIQITTSHHHVNLFSPINQDSFPPSARLEYTVQSLNNVHTTDQRSPFTPPIHRPNLTRRSGLRSPAEPRPIPERRSPVRHRSPCLRPVTSPRPGAYPFTIVISRNCASLNR